MPGKFSYLTAYNLNQWLASWHNRAANIEPPKSDALKITFEDAWEPPTEAEKEKARQITEIAKHALRDATASMKSPRGPDGEPLPKLPTQADKITPEEWNAKRLKALEEMRPASLPLLLAMTES